MSQELIYTSAPRGLQPGSQGFCTVAATRGMSAALMEKLESLTGYKPLYPPNDPRAELNPVAYLHVSLTVAGQAKHVLGRVGPAGLDYTGRTNKIAHFVVLEPTELPAAGPAWLLSQPDFFETAWQGTPRALEGSRKMPHGKWTGGSAHWQKITGDGGWAGALAETYLREPTQPMHLLFDPRQQVLPLFAEAIHLLPVDERWNVGLSTYFVNLPAGVACAWRGVPAGTPEAEKLRQQSPRRTWLLTPALGKADGGELVSIARTGGKAPLGKDFEPRINVKVPQVDEEPDIVPEVVAAPPVGVAGKQLHLGDLGGKKAAVVAPVKTFSEPSLPSKPSSQRNTRNSDIRATSTVGILFSVIAFVLLFAGIIAIEASSQSSMAELVGVKRHPEPVLLANNSNEQIEILEQEINRCKKKLADDAVAIGDQTKHVSELSRQLSEAKKIPPKVERDAQDVLKIGQQDEAIKKLTVANGDNLKNLNELQKKYDSLVSLKADPDKKIQNNTKPPKRPRNPSLAILCDKLVLPYPRQSDAIDLTKLLDLDAIDATSTRIEMKHLLGVAKTGTSDGTKLFPKNAPDGKSISILVNPDEVIGEFKLQGGRLSFEYRIRNFANTDIADARELIRQSIVQVKIGTEVYYVNFQPPAIGTKVETSLVSRNDFIKLPDDQCRHVTKYVGKLNLSNMSKRYFLDKPQLQVEAAFVRVGKNLHELLPNPMIASKQKSTEKQLRFADGGPNHTQQIPAYNVIVLNLNGTDTTVSAEQFSNLVEVPGNSPAGLPKDASDDDMRRHKEASRKYKERVNEFNGSKLDLLDPPPTLEKLIVTAVVEGVHIPLYRIE